MLASGYEKLGATQMTFSKTDESDLVLVGYLAFLDPPKETAHKAIEALRQNGVTVKVLTGDNDLVTRKVCSEVGIHAEKILLGSQVENLTEEQLCKEVEILDVFARLSPSHKKRVVQALQCNKHVVGFMGDGINDAPALRAADVGISVDTAVDIAKESADMIFVGEEFDGARGRRARRPEGVRQYTQIYPDGREFEFRQYVQRARSKRMAAVPADAAHSGLIEQSALRFFAGADSDRQRRFGDHLEAASMAHGNLEVHPVHRPD